jgi:glucose-1-phosphate thymidylyltransferase
MMSSGIVKKGIILAGGRGSRLYPLTEAVCKQLLPAYDKPLIYYPLATLMQFGIREILIISTPEDIPRFEGIFGDGHYLGLNIIYAIQPRPEGIAQALIIGERFIGSDPVALILGDNIFYGLDSCVSEIEQFTAGGLIFGYFMKDPGRYGVIEFDKNGRPAGIEEKPVSPKSNYAVTGFYFYDNEVIEIARSIKPSARGELEITDVNNAYLKRGKLKVLKLERGIGWLDTGTFDSLLEAANFIATIEKRQGVKIGCIEETALRMNYVTPAQFELMVQRLPENGYREYLEDVLREPHHDK